MSAGTMEPAPLEKRKESAGVRACVCVCVLTLLRMRLASARSGRRLILDPSSPICLAGHLLPTSTASFPQMSDISVRRLAASAAPVHHPTLSANCPSARGKRQNPKATQKARGAPTRWCGCRARLSAEHWPELHSLVPAWPALSLARARCRKGCCSPRW
jgi:hypothetical protein